MKSLLKNILKWLVCVLLTFTVIFTISHFYEIASGMYFKTAYLGDVEKFEEDFGEENISEIIKTHDIAMERQFLSGDREMEDVFSKRYPQYPAGVTMSVSIIAQYLRYGEVTIVSLVLGLIIGTAIFMVLDKEKKGLKTVIIVYIISIVILGLIKGLLCTTGENLTISDIWTFPAEYIVPLSITFAIVIAVKFIRQKDIANKLNEKLKKVKEDKNK